MKELAREELDKILEKHKHWLLEDCVGWENMRANLYNADLRNADLRNADLRNANLRNANLCNADLYNADLRNANLYNANLYNANLYNADLRNATNIPYIPMVCPEEGEFVGWKKAGGNIIVKLLISSDAKRSSATTRKCRCNKAKVLELYNPDGTIATESIGMSARNIDYSNVSTSSQSRGGKCSMLYVS